MRNGFLTKHAHIGLLGVLIISIGCEQRVQSVEHGRVLLTIDENLRTSISFDQNTLTPFQETEYLQLKGVPIGTFKLTSQEEKASVEGRIYTFTGVDPDLNLQKTLVITKLDSVEHLLLLQVIYENKSEKDLAISGWVNNGYALPLSSTSPPFWAFQGSSSGERADWITPLDTGYFKQNYLGMNSSDYGGGIPVTDLWCPEYGIAIGHASTVPELVSLPTEIEKYGTHARIAVEKTFEHPYYLEAGATLETLETFVILHDGDYFAGLQTYAGLMAQKGIQQAPAEPAAFESIWCAWGYGRDFSLNEVIGTLPKVKELGIKWAVMDDGFQQAEGDWHTNPQKFPKGDGQMKELVTAMHAHDLKAMLWWAPLAADPTSKLLKENPDMRLYLADWAPQYITWWDAYYLSPTHPKTIAHTEEIVNLFLNEWKFDGLKLDGQHMNAVAPDHNHGTGLDNPEDATKLLPDFYKLIYEKSREINPQAVIENCPCGTCMSFFHLPYTNQTVASDPLSSWQVRLKGKTYKALAPGTAYFGDHVELSDRGNDFASSFGVGAVLGTKFTWPANNPTGEDFLLTPEKELVWKKWFSIYDEKMLSKETYLGSLYDIGYDKPETHVIKKGDTLHYAFYAKNWTGKLEFRGLAEGTYEVRDYFNDQVLGTLQATNPYLELTFEQFLLAEVYLK